MLELIPPGLPRRPALLASVPDEALHKLILDQETTPREKREETEVRRQLAAHYWRANEALKDGDTAIAERELDAMHALQAAEASENVRILLGAVERKIRKRQR